MRCPKCGYVSFEYLDTCKKCAKDLFEFKEKAGIFLMEPGYLNLNKYAEGLKAESAPSAVETEEMEYGEGGEDGGAEGPVSVTETNFFDSLDMGVEQETAGVADNETGGMGGDEGIGLDLAEVGGEDISLSVDEAEGHDLTVDEGVLGLDMGSEEETRQGAGEAGIDLLEGPEIEIEEAGSGGAARASKEPEGVDLNEDDGLSGLDMGGEEITLDLEEEESGAGAAEESDIKVNMNDDEALVETAGDIDFSINLDEDISSSHEEESEDGIDLDGDIDLMLDDLDEGPEKP
ncbi:MAG: hypothetical protein HZA01_03190 [Nitrospinae bacterium]|nr:hypothetical protein [Nitrospinota bacterium]